MIVPSGEFARVEGSLSYTWNGVTGGVPLVFLHGFGDMGECWSPLIDLLRLDQPIYLLDAPGHGHSVLDPAADFIDQLLERAISFIRSLERPAILIGHSMGALQSMYIAGDMPDLVHAVVLEDPPMAPDLSPWRDPETIANLFNFLRDFRDQDAISAEAQILASQPAWPAAEFEPWVRSKQLTDPRMQAHFRVHREPMETTLARIHCPALLLTGDPQAHAIVTAETAAWARTLCPTLFVTRFSNAGHSIHRDSPEAVAATIMAFISEQP